MASVAAMISALELLLELILDLILDLILEHLARPLEVAERHINSQTNELRSSECRTQSKNKTFGEPFQPLRILISPFNILKSWCQSRMLTYFNVAFNFYFPSELLTQKWKWLLKFLSLELKFPYVLGGKYRFGTSSVKRFR